MKKIILGLVALILIGILALIIIFIFNPFNLRTKMIGGIINSYLSSKIENYTPLEQKTETGTTTASEVQTDKNPLLNADQEKTLESLGVDVGKLPKEITPSMEACFIEKLGASRAAELVGGATPSAMDLFKAGSCIGA